MAFMDLWLWPFMILGGVIAVIVGILVFAFWIWMIIDCAKRNFRNDIEKIVWIIVIVLGSWLGALIYLLVVRISNPKGLAKK